MLEILDEFVRLCEENNLTYFLDGGTLLGAVRHKGFIPWDDDIDVAMPRDDYEKFLDIFAAIKDTNYYVLSDRYSKNTVPFYEPFAKLCKKGTLVVKNNMDPAMYKGINIDIWPFDKCILQFVPFQTKLVKFVWRLYRFKIHHMEKPKKKIKIFIARVLCFFLTKRFLEKLSKKLYLLFNNFNTRYITFFSGRYGWKKETQNYNTIFPLSKLNFEGKNYNTPGNWDMYLKKLYNNYMELPPVDQQIPHDSKYVVFN